VGLHFGVGCVIGWGGGVFGVGVGAVVFSTIPLHQHGPFT